MTKVDIHEIVETLKNERSLQKFTLDDIAYRVGCTKSSVWAWEHHRYLPSLPNLAAWAYSLGYALDLGVREL